MKSYLAILREFWRVSFLVPGITFVVIAIPVAIFWMQAYFNSKLESNISAYRGTYIYPVLGCLAGFALSLPILQMNNRHLRITLPQYAKKIVRATVVLAVGTVTFLTLTIVAISYGMQGFHEALRHVPVFTYGFMGIGFMLATFAPIATNGRSHANRASTLIFTLTLAVLALVVVSANNEQGRDFLMRSVMVGVPIRVADVLCLLTGPLLWPVYVKFLHDDGLPARPTSVSASNATKGDGWLLNRLSMLKGAGPKAEFLALHHTLLKYGPMGFVMSSAMVLGLSLLFTVSDSSVANQSIFPKELEFLWWYPVMVMALLPAGSNVVTSATFGRVLLLPGLPSRASFPKWIALRFLGFWIAGACMTLLPILVVSVWAGISGRTVLIAGLLTCFSICAFAMLMFWMHPSRDKQFVKSGLFLRLLLFFYSVAFLIFNPVEVAAGYSLTACALVLLSAFVLPYALYRLGLFRWRGMKYVG